MKKVFISLLCGSCFFAQAQNEKDIEEENKKIKVSLAGGMFTFAGSKGVFLGFLGPKVSTTIQTKKIGYELGINGFPGLYIPYKGKVTPGLGLGGSVVFKTKSKVKPSIGIAFTYSQNKWHPMGGFGFSF
jgi:hypothetical protein